MFNPFYASIHGQNVRIICLDFHPNSNTRNQGRNQGILSLWLLSDRTFSRLLFITTADGPIVGDMRRVGISHFGGYPDCSIDVLVSLPQEDRVFEASPCLLAFAAEPGLISVYRTDSMITTLMIYSINTGLFTR